MKNLWLKIGCMLTGYKYLIISDASEASTRTVKKYVSALLIVSMLWGFIGFSFANRYLQTSTSASSIVALIMIVIVIQIERQIILSSGKNWLIPVFRTLIGDRIVLTTTGKRAKQRPTITTNEKRAASLCAPAGFRPSSRSPCRPGAWRKSRARHETGLRPSPALRSHLPPFEL